MPESRLERTRRAYDRVIDMGPYGCKILDVGTPDNRSLSTLWELFDSERANKAIINAERENRRILDTYVPGWNVIEGEH